MSDKRAIVHVEIPSKDRGESAKFYADLFGWEMMAHDEMNYTSFNTEGVGGGFSPLGEMSKVGNILVYIHSEDIDADLKAIEKHGGKALMPKTEIPKTGWFAVFSDPTGNNIGLYTEMNGQG